MKKYIYYILIICLATMHLCCTTNLSDDEKQPEQKLIEGTKVVLGVHGREFVRNKLALNNKELLKVRIHSSNPAERIYAFWAYLIQGNRDYQKELEELIVDTAVVESHYDGSGDFGPIEVRRAVLQIAQNFDTFYGNYQPLTYFLDSIILTLPHEGSISGIVHCRMANITNDERFYGILRKRAYMGYGKRGATIGLSKFRCAKDTQLIKDLLYSDDAFLSGISCVENFPHIAFQEPLLEAFNRRLKQKYPITLMSICELLLNYNTRESYRAINRIIQNSDSLYYHAAILKLALDRSTVNVASIKKKLINKIGINELDKRIAEYKSPAYWKKSMEEKNTGNN